ncbi:hypothetical protein BCR39DRAFT_524693 [Naematelia encephala]|uniref:Uncharacterized protein n=1 Tax=Naematelia encephala TaxID=71784 RepID=A0A1Y2BAR3_9TREE|nr:hypothetical protein BCR39DRAFT_524693 [Naematelia encephala]
MYSVIAPVSYSPAGPLITSYPYTSYYGMYSPLARYGYGPNYGVGWGSWYAPYGYMSGTYW